MASEIRLRPRARADLGEIFAYSIERWSVSRADRYILALTAGMEAVTRSPDLGRAIEGIEPPIRSYAVASHLIVCRSTPRGIDVVRVLHRRMDVVSRIQS
ncbi:type II toxin-antitoxin system RelE/ParE family toxin [Aureimonas sp. AU12]|uniref:type II toxin-antitoxin system RelE/ParE family toxin n=1 Tax=Aureimonas sp. AU12 TaxID=1638161 RepID=UPI000785BFFC|nr:type II toxin-antitoxin system RelE/ParE family toxin [Aureimonas sp. AU12]